MIKKFESFNSEEHISRIEGETIYVLKNQLDNLFNNVGEGIEHDDDIQIKGNVVFVEITESAWGGTSLREWNDLDDELIKMVNKNGFEDYFINPSRNKVSLEFSKEYEVDIIPL